MILEQKARVNFKDAYDSLPRNLQPQFRHTVMASQKWDHRQRFYLAISGKKWLSKQQIEEIKAIFRQFGQEIN